VPGEFQHPLVQRAFDNIISAVTKTDKAPGILVPHRKGRTGMEIERSALHHGGDGSPAGAGSVQLPENHARELIAERTRRRVTWRLLPFLIVAYLLAYMDRANVGVAKLQMQTDLGFSNAIIGFGAGILFVGYFLLEVPGSLIVERYSARKWFARITISWGICAAATSLVTTPHQFYFCRFLLGAAEAGFFPGVIVYLSHWFRYEDRTRAKSWFMMTQPLSIVVGTPLSRWILETVHWHGLHGWRWVFILEGVPSVLCGIAALYYLPDRPADARWLKDDERKWLIGELTKEASRKAAAGRTRILSAFRHWQTLLLIAVLFLLVSGNQALHFFLPSIAENMKGLSIRSRTVVAVLPYVCSMFGIVLNGYSSNRRGERRWHTAIPIFIAATALGLSTLAGDHVALVIALLCVVGFTFQAYLSPFWTLPTAYLGSAAAATVIGTINSVGNLGGFVGPYIFGYLKDATGRYNAGLWFLSASMFASGLLASQIRIEKRSKQE
jgi:MFS family permease